jgi:hypothetical protein
MTDAGLLWVSGGLSVIGIASLAGAMAIIWRRSSATTASPSVEIAPALHCSGPIVRLDFAQSLDPTQFAKAAEEEALAYASVHLRDVIADGTTITLQALRQWAAQPELLVGASAGATKAIRTGAAVIQRHGSSTRLLPHVIDRQSGQMLEVMKEVGYGRKAITGAAAVSTIVVSAAHMIATADLARKLKLVDEKLDLLLAYRRIDQQAALERIYTAARELLAAPPGEMRRMEVWRLRGELRELRATWRLELEHHLSQIENPAEEAWIDRMFTTQNSYDKRITARISGGLLQLTMVEYSLRIDRVLAAASGTWDASEATLAGELAAIERVGALLKDKAGFISERHRGSAQPMIEGIGMMVAQYRTLLRSRPDLPAAPGITAAQAVPLLEGK